MDDIELTSRRGFRSNAYDQLPQHEAGVPSVIPPSHLGTMSPYEQKPMEHSISQSNSISPLVEMPDTHKLPPRAYHQLSRKRRIWTHVAWASAFIFGLGLPLAVLLPPFLSDNFDGYFGITYCTTLQNVSFDMSLSEQFSYILNLSVAYGKFSFGTAKLIDLVWDFFISRGGQIGVGYIAYRVHAAALMRIMEDKLVSYDLYATMTLSWATLMSLCPIFKSFFTNLGFRRRLLLLWMAVSILYVAIWPTITNAMTGYVAENTTLVKLADGSGYAEFSDVANDTTLAFQFQANKKMGNYSAIGPVLTRWGPEISLWMELSAVFNSYTNANKPDAIYNSSLPGSNASSIAQLRIEDSTPASVFYYYNSQKYYITWFQQEENVQCVATSTYQWGFSFGVMVIFLAINTFWVIGTYGVWIHMHRKSEFSKVNRTIGKYRAAIDIAEAIHNSIGTDICAYSDDEIERELSRGQGIKYAVAQRKGDSASHIGLSSAEDGEKLRLNFGELYGRTQEDS